MFPNYFFFFLVINCNWGLLNTVFKDTFNNLVCETCSPNVWESIEHFLFTVSIQFFWYLLSCDKFVYLIFNLSWLLNNCCCFSSIHFSIKVYGGGSWKLFTLSCTSCALSWSSCPLTSSPCALSSASNERIVALFARTCHMAVDVVEKSLF